MALKQAGGGGKKKKKKKKKKEKLREGAKVTRGDMGTPGYSFKSLPFTNSGNVVARLPVGQSPSDRSHFLHTSLKEVVSS